MGWDWQQAGNGEEAGAAAGRAGGAGSKAAPEAAAAGHRRSAGAAQGLVLPLMMCWRRVRACMDMDMDMDGRDGACQDDGERSSIRIRSRRSLVVAVAREKE